MSEEQLNLPRKLFGVPSSAVEQLLEERDRMLDLAERRVKMAEGRATELESQLRLQEQAFADLERQRAVEDEANATREPEQPEPAAHPQAMAEELSKVVTAAEESTQQIIQAWLATRDQIQQADRLWGDVHAEIVRFAAWREEVEPLIREVQEAIVDARASIDEVPQRVEQALAPAADAMAAVGVGMNRFAEATPLPDLPPAPDPGPEPVEDHVIEPEGPEADDPDPSWPNDGVEVVPLPSGQSDSPDGGDPVPDMSGGPVGPEIWGG